MHLGNAALLSNQFAVHRLEFVRRRLDALRNLVCHPLGDGKQWKGDQTPASRGLRRSPVKTDRLARRSSGRCGARAFARPPAAAPNPAVLARGVAGGLSRCPFPHPRKTRRWALTPRPPPSWAISAATEAPEPPPTENAAFLEGNLEVYVIYRRDWLCLRCLDKSGGCRVGRTRSGLGRAKRASRRGRSPQEAVCKDSYGWFIHRGLALEDSVIIGELRG